MTLIAACFPKDSPPVLIADLLVTSNRPLNIKQRINLLSGRNSYAEKVNAYAELQKKLYLLKPHVVICFSGTESRIATFLKKLTDEIKKCPDDAESIRALLDNVFLDTNPKETAIICLIYNIYDKKIERWIKGNIHEAKNQTRFGTVICAGEGSNSLLKKISDSTKLEEFRDRRPTRDELSMLRLITLGQSFLFDETMNKEEENPLRNKFGGGFEYCYFSEQHEQFYLINNITTFIWEIRYAKNPPYEFLFGHGPRDSNEKYARVGIYKNSYKKNNFYMTLYTNVVKTESGHVMKRQKIPVKILVPSLYEYDPYYDDRFSCNVFYVTDDPRKKYPNTHFFVNFRHISRRTITISSRIFSNIVDLIITPAAMEEAKEIVRIFMRTRESQRRT